MALGIFCSTTAQDITGDWHGFLKEFQLRIVYHITETKTGFTSTMDSPDQGANGIPVTETLFENSVLTMTATNIGATFKGTLTDGIIDGNFAQGGMMIPLKLTRDAQEKPTINRPQEPMEPYPYYSEEVSFRNEEVDITLAGTLTLPEKEGKFPVVILITGSGPQDRNEELVGHKPFLVLADHLTRNGIAVLRYDDRGFGQSTGNFESATSADFATDVVSAIAYVKTRKEIELSKIGLVGHSEGGLIAPMVASTSNDVNFIVLLAGPGLRGDRLILKQQELIARAAAAPEEDIRLTKDLNTQVFKMILDSGELDTLRSDLIDFMNKAYHNEAKSLVPEGMTVENFISSQVNVLATPWLVYFVKHDPVPFLEQVDCAVLAMNGAQDLQVPAKENLDLIAQALKRNGNEKGTFIELPGLNHLFQESATGSPSEYSTLEQTFAPLALESISKWILDQVK